MESFQSKFLFSLDAKVKAPVTGRAQNPDGFTFRVERGITSASALSFMSQFNAAGFAARFTNRFPVWILNKENDLLASTADSFSRFQVIFRRPSNSSFRRKSCAPASARFFFGTARTKARMFLAAVTARAFFFGSKPWDREFFFTPVACLFNEIRKKKAGVSLDAIRAPFSRGPKTNNFFTTMEALCFYIRNFFWKDAMVSTPNKIHPRKMFPLAWFTPFLRTPRIKRLIAIWTCLNHLNTLSY